MVLRVLSELEWVNVERPLTRNDFENRVILLDFWTFCCINCIHVLPDLKQLETEFGRDLLVLGIHSPKFENEKNTDALKAAIAKYNIQHPVANDAHFILWRSLSIRAWPTFVLLNPHGHVEMMTSGEGAYEKLAEPIARLIQNAKAENILKPHTIKTLTIPLSTADRILSYPTKLTAAPAPTTDEPQSAIFISNSARNQIIQIDNLGRLKKTWGSGTPDFRDGAATTAAFKAPQGIAARGQKLYVADTENHAIRVIDMATNQISTLIGTGRQGMTPPLTKDLSSPWDIAFWRDELIIAMAGTHQLYTWRPTRGLRLLAGSAIENIDDGPFERATLAQPSALSVDEQDHLYFIDAETSAFRMLRDAHVITLVGDGLFEFGLVDGLSVNARLQHPLGLHATQNTAYIADTYNHAIRVWDFNTGRLSTLIGGGRGNCDGDFETARLNEPGDVMRVNDKLWIVDTNNHAIRIADLKKKRLTTLAIVTDCDDTDDACNACDSCDGGVCKPLV